MNEYGLKDNETLDTSIKYSFYSKDIYEIGRLEYFLTAVILSIVGPFVLGIIGGGIYFILDAVGSDSASTTILLKVIAGFLYLPLLYLFSLNTAKRAYSIGWCDEHNALSRAIAFELITNYGMMIPLLNLGIALFGFVVRLILLFKE